MPALCQQLGSSCFVRAYERVQTFTQRICEKFPCPSFLNNKLIPARQKKAVKTISIPQSVELDRKVRQNRIHGNNQQIRFFLFKNMHICKNTNSKLKTSEMSNLCLRWSVFVFVFTVILSGTLI